MIKNLVLTALVTLFLGVIAVSAQDKKTDFSGTWNLDVSKSKLDERMRVESMTLTVSQTDKELKESTVTKRAPRPEGEQPSGNGGGNNGGGMMGGGRQGGGMGRGMGGDTNATYTLDGKETTVQQDSPMGQTPVKLKATFEKDGKLKLSSSRTLNFQGNEVSITSKETWELVDGGKGLKVHRETESPRGSQSTDFYYTKQ